MSELALQPVSAAGLMLTDWCPARCRHCYVSCGPRGRAWMDTGAAAGHLAALARMGAAPEEVHVGGGEPFGDVERLTAVVRAAPGGVGYVETCGHWATDEALVRERLGALAEAGMRQIAISADPYHQEFVPPDRVRRLYDVAREVLGPGGVRARRWRWLKDPRDVSSLDAKARDALFAEYLARYPERMTGRATEMLAHLLDRRPVDEIEPGPCRRPLEAAHVHIMPDGTVVPGTCAGLVLGRATPERPLDELLAAWSAAASPTIRALAEGGPHRLAEMAARGGWTPSPEGYAGRCHLCTDVRRALARTRRYPDIASDVTAPTPTGGDAS